MKYWLEDHREVAEIEEELQRSKDRFLEKTAQAQFRIKDLTDSQAVILDAEHKMDHNVQRINRFMGDMRRLGWDHWEYNGSDRSATMSNAGEPLLNDFIVPGRSSLYERKRLESFGGEEL